MPQFVVIGLGIILLFRKSFEAIFSTIFKSKESKAVGIAVAAYFLYTRVFKKEQKTDIMLNAGSDQDTQNVMALFGALHPVFTEPVFGWYPPDGTDEATAFSIAAKYRGRYKELAERYKLIYGIDLATDLQSEGILTEFMSIINGGASGSVGGSISDRIGSTLSVKANWQIREYTSGVVLGATKAGDQFKVLNVVENSTLGGILGAWVHVTYYPNMISIGRDAWINSGAFNPY